MNFYEAGDDNLVSSFWNTEKCSTDNIPIAIFSDEKYLGMRKYFVQSNNQKTDYDYSNTMIKFNLNEIEPIKTRCDSNYTKTACDSNHNFTINSQNFYQDNTEQAKKNIFLIKKIVKCDEQIEETCGKNYGLQKRINKSTIEKLKRMKLMKSNNMNLSNLEKVEKLKILSKTVRRYRRKMKNMRKKISFLLLSFLFLASRVTYCRHRVALSFATWTCAVVVADWW